MPAPAQIHREAVASSSPQNSPLLYTAGGWPALPGFVDQTSLFVVG
jgi:hypothetical protein